MRLRRSPTFLMAFLIVNADRPVFLLPLVLHLRYLPARDAGAILFATATGLFLLCRRDGLSLGVGTYKRPVAPASSKRIAGKTLGLAVAS